MPSGERPGRFGYFAAVAAVVAGFAGAVALVAHLVTGLDGGLRFVVPGRVAIEAQHPARYVIWHDYRTVFQGRAYDHPEQVPDGARIRVTGGSGEVEVVPARGMSSKMDAADSVSVASFELPAPGRYEIAVEGEFEPRVFSVGESKVLRIVGYAFGAIGSIFLGLTVAVVLLVWTIVKRHPAQPVAVAPRQAGAPAAVPAEPSRRPPEDAAKELATVVYALQAASFLVGVSLIAAVILNYVTRKEVAGTWVESHYRWQIRTFWWCLGWILLGLVLLIVLVGLLVWLAAAVWLIYRIVKGWVRLSEGKAMYE